jgi:hypothetical protein
VPRVRSLSLVVAVALAALGALPAFASAAEITVNTIADQPPSTPECAGAANDCSLRQAIDLANKQAGPDTVVLPAGGYALTIKGSGEDEGKSGDLDVVKGSVVTVKGTGARTTTVSATGLGDRVFDVLEGGQLTLSGLTVSGGEAIGEDGGGIRVEQAGLLLEGVAVRNNVSSKRGYGGGIISERSSLTIVASLLAENRNSGDGGGFESNESQVAIVNTTIANNVVDTSLYPESPGWGAFGGGAEVDDGTLRMQNVTVSGNSIRDGNGGGEGEGAGLAVYKTVTSEFVNTIVSGNTATEVEKTGQCYEPVTSIGHNLEAPEPAGEPRCFSGPTDLIGDPLLRPLANNGGETDTMALRWGSPAINTGDPANCPATDQRGVKRPQLGTCDIGAFEFVPPAPKIKRKGKVHVKAAGKTFLVKPGFRVTCPAGNKKCSGTIKVLKKGVIGKQKFTVGGGKTKGLSLKLNGKGAKLLEQLGKLKARFEVVCRGSSNEKVKATKKLVLELP